MKIPFENVGLMKVCATAGSGNAGIGCIEIDRDLGVLYKLLSVRTISIYLSI